MTFTPLADAADLPAALRDHEDATRALEVASASIREAAGHPILATTATATLDGGHSALLRLPSPVRDVTAVEINGKPVADYTALLQGLHRPRGWGGASVVTVSATFGYDAVPDDIVDLCASFAQAWLEHRDSGAGSLAGLKSVKIDDASESYTDEASGHLSPVFIPEVTRAWLRERFGGGAVVVESL